MEPIRFIFSVAVLAMWIICGVGMISGQWTAGHWLLLGLGHLGCAIIFVSFVQVFSYGYALSMVLVNVAVMALRPAPAALLVAGLGAAYGLRLFGFVYGRNQSRGYAAIRARGQQANTSVPLPLRIFMWISCAWLMTFLGVSAWIAGTTDGLPAGTIAGGGLMLAGLLLEAVADRQKQAAKAVEPAAFVTGGLYRGIRHPNYLGEIVFQLGLLLAALTAANGTWMLAAALPGPAYIVVLMYYAARDQDRQQDERYGTDPAYQSYRQQSGSLLPG